MAALDLFAAYLAFCAIMAGSPGPNNMMMLTSGVRVGTRRSLPLAFGVACGMAILLTAVGLGLGAMFQIVPALKLVMRALSAAFLIWLAWKIATAGPLRPPEDGAPILGFRTGLLFQWINPKSWAVTTSAVATYLPEGGGLPFVVAGAAILGTVALCTTTIWIIFGGYLSRFLHDPRRATIFNIAMAVLLLASTLPILFGQISL
ncbi:LysE family translocator [Oricola sp.]|uniref:LysE family translocator n=1 Tax=Oricola sp. TaxID=1979950 RepID=UPI003BACBD18